MVKAWERNEGGKRRKTWKSNYIHWCLGCPPRRRFEDKGSGQGGYKGMINGEGESDALVK